MYVDAAPGHCCSLLLLSPVGGTAGPWSLLCVWAVAAQQEPWSRSLCWLLPAEPSALCQCCSHPVQPCLAVLPPHTFGALVVTEEAESAFGSLGLPKRIWPSCAGKQGLQMMAVFLFRSYPGLPCSQGIHHK